MKQKSSSAIILAAGKSGRMGTHKFALKLPDGKAFLEHIAEQYSLFGCKKIIVVVNPEGRGFISENPLVLPDILSFTINQHPEYERFYSLQCGLKELTAENAVFVHNVDNPIVDQKVLLKLMENITANGLVKPVYKNHGGHPILLGREAVRLISQEKDSSINLREYLVRFKRKSIEVDNAGILLNINTLEDYQEFLIAANNPPF